MSKIKYVHDYICLSTEYDYAALEAGDIGGKYQTAYSTAVDYKTVCAGYTSLFAYYKQNLGIPCTYISNDSHAWNLLKVNGQCYQMDVTWNDADLIPPYYNLTHEEMGEILEQLKAGNICNWHKGQRSYVGKSVIYDLTLAAPTKQSGVVQRKDDSQTAKDTETVSSQNNTNSQTTKGTETVVSKKTDDSQITTTSKTSTSQKNTESQTTKTTVKKSPPKICDKGPGGGIVFYIEGNKAYECSELLGKGDWKKAEKLCTNYRGSGKSDWYLPTDEELNYIYKNLAKAGIINEDLWYWSSSTSNFNFAYIQRLSDGYQTDDHTGSTLSVRAVRSFEY